VHLATVTLLRPAACGDLRDLINVMAALPHTGQHTDPNPEPTAADPHQAEGIDLIAAALYGPPDRLPRATLEEKMLDRGQGRVRNYLEGTTASRLLAPG
jgi:hypothetical protein